MSQKNSEKSKIFSNQVIGILGGGQLGRMICFYAQMMGFRTVIFTNEQDSPASQATNQTVIGDFEDETALQKFCDLVDFATFEFENIPLTCAEYVAKQIPLFPKPAVLAITQNRILEKNFLKKIGVKTVDFTAISSLDELKNSLKIFQKAILKTAIMGYDGKGQFVLSYDFGENLGENQKKLAEIYQETCASLLILEKFCPFDSEISVIVARSKSGEVLPYEPLTNIHKNGILDRSLYPAKISDDLKKSATVIATKIAREIDLVGIMAVEFFVCGDELLVNELAPRPHNSGHFSMNGAYTSQFEQLIRAISGLALGDCSFHSQGEMKNLIGDEVNNLENYLKNPLAKLHLYGKKEVKMSRKMGHVNIIAKPYDPL